VLYQPGRDLQRRVLISVLAGNMEEEMLLTAMFKTKHTRTHTERERERERNNINKENYT
jgi:hypothetical protein